MTLMGDNPHVKNVAIVADPKDDNPYGFRVVISTDLDPDSRDDNARREVQALLAACERHLRLNKPALTRITLMRV